MADKITRALIIDEPWISLTLKGRKLWEMRSSMTNIRGQIALIKKGTKTVVGFATIINSYGPLSQSELKKNKSKHCIPEKLFSDSNFKWKYVWQLEKINVLSDPVPITQLSGAVIWVKLDVDTSNMLTNLASE